MRDDDIVPFIQSLDRSWIVWRSILLIQFMGGWDKFTLGRLQNQLKRIVLFSLPVVATMEFSSGMVEDIYIPFFQRQWQTSIIALWVDGLDDLFLRAS